MAREARKKRKIEKLKEAIGEIEEEIGVEVFINVVEEETANCKEVAEKIRRCEKLRKEYAAKIAELELEAGEKNVKNEKIEKDLNEEIERLRVMKRELEDKKVAEEKDKIMKQKAREAKEAAASAKKDVEEKDKIMKQKAREAKEAAASAEKVAEEKDKIMKQKAREAKEAAASAKKDIEEKVKIMKQKAREAKEAAASDEKDDEQDRITKQEAREAKSKDGKGAVDNEVKPVTLEDCANGPSRSHSSSSRHDFHFRANVPKGSEQVIHAVSSEIALTYLRGENEAKAEMVNNLGAIAKSGISWRRFYFSYLVADKVMVTPKHNGDEQYIGESRVEGPSTIVRRGNKIVLHMKEGQVEFLEEKKLKEIVEKHSRFVGYPIRRQVQKERGKEVSDDEEDDDKKDETKIDDKNDVKNDDSEENDDDGKCEKDEGMKMDAKADDKIKSEDENNVKDNDNDVEDENDDESDEEKLGEVNLESDDNDDDEIEKVEKKTATRRKGELEKKESQEKNEAESETEKEENGEEKLALAEEESKKIKEGNETKNRDCKAKSKTTKSGGEHDEDNKRKEVNVGQIDKEKAKLEKVVQSSTEKETQENAVKIEKLLEDKAKLQEVVIERDAELKSKSLRNAKRVKLPKDRSKKLEIATSQSNDREKTIAALALLLANRSFQPAPFFVMDEIDAALDNANIGKVAEYINAKTGDKKMSVVVISLKEEFYSHADALVGIATDSLQMLDTGCLISKVLILNLTDYDNTVELHSETKLPRQFDPGIKGDWSCSRLNLNPAVGREGLVSNHVEAAGETCTVVESRWRELERLEAGPQCGGHPA